MNIRNMEPKKTDAQKKMKAPKFLGWKTSDEEEIERRRWRGITDDSEFSNLEPEFGHFGTFKVASSSGSSYFVEIRDPNELRNSCTCKDFKVSGLGTCKHVERVLHGLREANGQAFDKAAKSDSPRIEIYLADDRDGLPTMEAPAAGIPGDLAAEVAQLVASLRERPVADVQRRLHELKSAHPSSIRISRLLESWVSQQQRNEQKLKRSRKAREDIASGRLDTDVVKFSLFPYQVEGMLHLALGERALLADDMGLGKTVQALAATEMLSQLENVNRVLIVCPASLKAEWEEQIGNATERRCRIVFGPMHRRIEQYKNPEFYSITNYEQIRSDVGHIGHHLKPDLVILDEAQRIKNWRTQTAEAVKKLESPYAFVLTGTPLENRIDEVYSIVQYLDPELLGPLFRFNRRYFVLDDRGRPDSLKNLDELHERLSHVMLRRRKEDIEDDLPERTVNNFFLPMTDVQKERYAEYEYIVGCLASVARRRHLTEPEFKKMQMALACMRMLCDTAYILDETERASPKLEELERILEDLLAESDTKIIIFSEWVRMLSLARERLEEADIEFAWHVGSVPQNKRRREIIRFREDPDCRVFLSSESGGVGLNLQVANAVINLDLPWNPAKLEQRIARAWRKHQKRVVSVINLVAEDTIEHRMLYLLDAKQGLSDAVLDSPTEDGTMDLPSGRQAFLERLEHVLGAKAPVAKPVKPDPVEVSLSALKEAFGDRLYAVELRRDKTDQRSLLVVLRDEVDGAADDVSCPLPVKRINRESYETMLSMEENGLLDFTGNRIDMLFLESAKEREEKETSRLRAMAAPLLGEAERRREMASLLASGGFEQEAAKLAVSITVLSVRALALVTGIDTDEENEIPPHELCDCLIEAGELPADLAVSAYGLCVSDTEVTAALIVGGEESGGPQQNAGAMLDSAERILSYATSRIGA